LRYDILSKVAKLSAFVFPNFQFQSSCRAWTEVFNRNDGLFIVRYKLFLACSRMRIAVSVNGRQVAERGGVVEGISWPDTCNCPAASLQVFELRFKFIMLYKSVLWIGIVWIRIQIRMFILMPIRIRTGIRRMSIRMSIVPQVLHMLENQKYFFLLLVTAMLPVCTVHQCQRFHSFQYFGQHLELF
jgi:hypothetical protein